LGSEEAENNGKYRHHRVIRMEMAELDMSARKLSANQAHLDHQVRRLEKQMKTVLSNHRGCGAGGNRDAGVGEVAARQLQSRVSALELASRTAGKTVFNMSRQLVGLDKLHQSMLQLLESVETLENKVDRTLPDLQREISKMEFNMAQMTSSVTLLKEDQVGTMFLATSFLGMAKLC
jgi:chromosome segregation ATPase